MPLPESTIIFQSPSRGISRRELRSYAARLSHDIAGGRAFCCLITRDNDLQRLNRQFLGKDYPTDVLSFPSTDSAAGLGDLAISLDRARVQASEYGHDIADEL